MDKFKVLCHVSNIKSMSKKTVLWSVIYGMDPDPNPRVRTKKKRSQTAEIKVF
jgi:hypothetical protein